MSYDFTTRPDRKDDGSSKWLAMYQKKPDAAPGIVPLSVADMELLPPPELVEGLQNYLSRTVLGYPRPTPRYLKIVRDWMKTRHNWDIADDWLVLSPGVVPALFMAVRAFTNEGDGVIVQNPVYYPFFQAITLNNRVIVNNPLILDEARLSYRIDYEGLEKITRNPKNKMLVLCSPHNPVSRVWTREELARLSEICVRNKVIVVSDEIHFDILMPGFKHTVYATISEEAANSCVVCTAPSKTFNTAGLAASNIIVPDKALRAKLAAEFARAGSVPVNNLGIKACEIAYTKCGAWLDGFLLLIEKNHALVKDFFEKRRPEIKVFPLEGTYLQWLDFRALGLDAAALERFMIDKAGWFTDEGYIFGNEGAGFERINLACPFSVIEEALERLGTAMRGL